MSEAPSAIAARTFAWFTAAAVGTWIACGLWPITEILNGHFGGWPAIVYSLAFMVYGAALLTMLVMPRYRPVVPNTVPITVALVETIAAVVMNVDTGWYLRGTGVGIGLSVIIAAQLPYFLKPLPTWTWIIVQTAVMTWGLGGFAPNAALIANVTFFAAAIGFQVFAAASTILALSEGRARTSLARANAELTATRELLAESSRTSERLRISRDLHDTLGHHLTALSLQLDVATRLSDARVADHIRQAHAITKLLLSDVRDVVSTLRETSRLNLAEAIRALAVQPTGGAVHLDMPDTLIVEDANRAEAILRAVQEVFTNTARHAHAGNLWLRVEATAESVIVHARDDGRGARAFTVGNGLRGMRERFEQYGGKVAAGPATAGFEVHAVMPVVQRST